MLTRASLCLLGCFSGACSLIAGGGSATQWACLPDDARVCDEIATDGQRYRCEPRPGEPHGICVACGTVDLCGTGLDEDCDGEIDNGSPETCNGLDDDCDGEIDNGLDEDGDGFSWCPTGPPPTDCDDSNPDVKPTRDGAPPELDRCDGLDNDCNPLTPDGVECDAQTQDCDGKTCAAVNCATRPTLCSDGQFCDQSRSPPTCEPISMTCVNPRFPCADGRVCVPEIASCVAPEPLGAPCDYDAECLSALCVPVEALRLASAHLADRGGICSRSCCSDRECADGQRCWAPGTGARACVPAAILSSGIHPAPQRGACASRADCGSSEACERFEDDAYQESGRIGLACGATYSDRDCRVDCLVASLLNGAIDPRDCDARRCRGLACFTDSECPSGLCSQDGCQETCAASEQCGSNASCRVRGITSGPGPADYLALCTDTGAGGVDGRPCAINGDCRDGTCVDRTGNALRDDDETPMRCADTCCSDASCAASEQCRPIAIRGHWENHCLPRTRYSTVAPQE